MKILFPHATTAIFFFSCGIVFLLIPVPIHENGEVFSRIQHEIFRNAREDDGQRMRTITLSAPRVIILLYRQIAPGKGNLPNMHLA